MTWSFVPSHQTQATIAEMQATIAELQAVVAAAKQRAQDAEADAERVKSNHVTIAEEVRRRHNAVARLQTALAASEQRARDAQARPGQARDAQARDAEPYVELQHQTEHLEYCGYGCEPEHKRDCPELHKPAVCLLCGAFQPSGYVAIADGSGTAVARVCSWHPLAETVLRSRDRFDLKLTMCTVAHANLESELEGR